MTTGQDPAAVRKVDPAAAVRVAAVAEGRTASQVPRIREYVAEVAGCAPDEVVSVSRFDDGNRHDVYKARFSTQAGVGGDIVVRISLVDDANEREQVEREASVLEKVGGVGAPELIDYRLSSPWFATPVLTMRFVPGRVGEVNAAKSADIERLGSVVAAVHALAVDDLVEWVAENDTLLSYAEGRLRQILNGLPWARSPVPGPVRDSVLHAAEAIESGWATWREAESFCTDDKLRLLHGDVAFGNVLWAPEPVLIDWEYARLGDPADEIAYLFDQNGLAAPQREAFWRGYQTRVGNASSLAFIMERVRWWEPMTLLGSTLWWVERSVRATEAQIAGTSDPVAPKDAVYYLDQAVRRLDRLERWL